MDEKMNIHLGTISHKNPLFIITHRAPAHVFCLESPTQVRDFLVSRLDEFPNDPERALDFEITDFNHA